MSPVEVFEVVAAALRAGEWRSAASLCDPVSLTAFKREVVQRHDPQRAQEHARLLTAEDYMRNDPELPRAVAEYYAARHQQQRDTPRVFDDELPGIDSFEQLVQLPAEDVYAAYLRGRSMQRQLERLIESGRIPAEYAEEARASCVEQSYRAVGFVEDGAQLAYVVFVHRHDIVDPEAAREAADAIAVLPPEEQQLVRELSAGEPMATTARRQADGSWRLIASHAFLAPGGWLAYESFVEVRQIEEEGDDEG